MTKIDRDKLHEFSAHKFCADASTLGLPVGVFPNEIDAGVLGNGLPLWKSSVSKNAVHYSQQLGCVRVIIFND